MIKCIYILNIGSVCSIVIPGLFNKRLYIYLKLCFMHWPLDASFRMVSLFCFLYKIIIIAGFEKPDNYFELSKYSFYP